MVKRGMRLGALGALCLTVIGWACAGANSRTVYFVTISTNASSGDVSALVSQVEQVTGCAVVAKQYSAIAYEWDIQCQVAPAAIVQLNQLLYDSPIVCSYCEGGMGCPATVMNKAGCK